MIYCVFDLCFMKHACIRVYTNVAKLRRDHGMAHLTQVGPFLSGPTNNAVDNWWVNIWA